MTDVCQSCQMDTTWVPVIEGQCPCHTDHVHRLVGGFGLRQHLQSSARAKRSEELENFDVTCGTESARVSCSDGE